MATTKKITKPRAAKTKAATKPAPAAVPAVKAVTVEVEKAAAQAQARVEKFATDAQAQMEKAGTDAMKAFDDAFAFSKHNVDAMLAAGDVYLRGVETFNQTMLRLFQQRVETGVFAAKSLQEVVALNNDFARKAFDDAVADTAALSELTTRVATDAAKPISARVQETVGTMFRTAA